MLSKPKILGVIVITTLTVVIAFSALTPFTTNFWLVLTGRDFKIPKESSLLTFRVTKMNSGSGEWWLYGEDNDYFYANSRAAGVKYHSFPRSKVDKCPGFDHLDFTTWCDSITLDHRTKQAEQGAASDR